MGIVVVELKSMNSNQKSDRYIHLPVQNEILGIITINQWVVNTICTVWQLYAVFFINGFNQQKFYVIYTVHLLTFHILTNKMHYLNVHFVG